MSVLHIICEIKDCWLISLILPCALFPLQIFLFCTYRVLYILYMMSSLGSDKARGPREKALPAATHTSQPQKQIQVSNRNHLNMKKNLMKAHSSEIQILKQDTSVHTATLGNKTTVHTLYKDLLGSVKGFYPSHVVY